MKKNEFITEDCIIEDETFSKFKNTLKCSICKKILKNPMQCNKCQRVFCKECIENYPKSKKKCPNGCKKPNYRANEDKLAMLSLLKFLCNNCKEEISYNDVESHLNRGCITNLSTCTLFDEIYAKKKLKKIKKNEIKNLNQKNINYLSSK